VLYLVVDLKDEIGWDTFVLTVDWRVYIKFTDFFVQSVKEAVEILQAASQDIVEVLGLIVYLVEVVQSNLIDWEVLLQRMFVNFAHKLRSIEVLKLRHLVRKDLQLIDRLSQDLNLLGVRELFVLKLLDQCLEHALLAFSVVFVGTGKEIEDVKVDSLLACHQVLLRGCVHVSIT
jgi:hypothetical protein